MTSVVATQTPGDFDLPPDHPGFSDAAYRTRRAAIALVGQHYLPGRPIPDVTYVATEDEVWRDVSRRLGILHRERACAAYRDGERALDLATTRVPQLREVDERVHALTGFHIQPVPGLVPTRTFYGALAERRFLSTQYVRHPSVPFYTPEPDIIHEIIGHANMLANPLIADLYERAGKASVRSRDEAQLERFSRVFWFTLEFGVVIEDGVLKAYGAGLLSSYGELQTFRQADIRPFDLGAMETTTYDITRYQPVLFAAESLDEMVRELGTYFDEVGRGHS